VAVVSCAIATIAVIDPSPGWLVVVGGYAFAVLLAAIAGLIALNELDARANGAPEEAPTPAPTPALLPAPAPFALLPPAPAPSLALLEPPPSAMAEAPTLV
jgi:hypothetical protein